MKTSLYQQHLSRGGKIVNFCDWEMPIHYAKGIIHEHMTVRKRVGIFDVSHMGSVHVTGRDAERFLDFLSTNIILGKKDCSATYTVWAKEDGGSVDDVIVYRRSSEEFFVVVNAGNRQKDLQHMKTNKANFDVTIDDQFNTHGIIALQGPKVLELLKNAFPEAEELKFMHFIDTTFKGKKLVLSKTGYTGSLGFECMAENTTLVELWEFFLEEGKELGIEPIGLGARDTLRLEMGFALYGHELTETIAPIESVSSWTAKLKKDNFLGKEALLNLKESGKKRKQYGIILEEKGIPREGYKVLKDGKEVGEVTSGGFSPCLEKGIAIVLGKNEIVAGDEVKVEIRKKMVGGRVVKFPFLNPQTLFLN